MADEAMHEGGGSVERRTVVYRVTVAFGDCDPAGIVFFPNFHRWMDASSHHFFVQCGVPPFRELERQRGIVGHPLLEHQTRFFHPATYGDEIEVHTSVNEWRAKVFVHRHVVKHRDRVLCEGLEFRTFVVRDPDAPNLIKAISIPEDIRGCCS